MQPLNYEKIVIEGQSVVGLMLAIMFKLVYTGSYTDVEVYRGRDDYLNNGYLKVVRNRVMGNPRRNTRNSLGNDMYVLDLLDIESGLMNERYGPLKTGIIGAVSQFGCYLGKHTMNRRNPCTKSRNGGAKYVQIPTAQLISALKKVAEREGVSIFENPLKLKSDLGDSGNVYICATGSNTQVSNIAKLLKPTGRELYTDKNDELRMYFKVTPTPYNTRTPNAANATATLKQTLQTLQLEKEKEVRNMRNKMMFNIPVKYVTKHEPSGEVCMVMHLREGALYDMLRRHDILNMTRIGLKDMVEEYRLGLEHNLNIYLKEHGHASISPHETILVVSPASRTKNFAGKLENSLLFHVGDAAFSANDPFRQGISHILMAQYLVNMLMFSPLEVISGYRAYVEKLITEFASDLSAFSGVRPLPVPIQRESPHPPAGTGSNPLAGTNNARPSPATMRNPLAGTNNARPTPATRPNPLTGTPAARPTPAAARSNSRIQALTAMNSMPSLQPHLPVGAPFLQNSMRYSGKTRRGGNFSTPAIAAIGAGFASVLAAFVIGSI